MIRDRFNRTQSLYFNVFAPNFQYISDQESRSNKREPVVFFLEIYCIGPFDHIAFFNRVTFFVVHLRLVEKYLPMICSFCVRRFSFMTSLYRCPNYLPLLGACKFVKPRERIIKKASH